jgi:hypothetical protein
MSVRAYRVIEIKTAKPDTFNLWHDEKLVNFFASEHGFFESMVDGSGLTQLSIEALKEALGKSELELDDDMKEALKRDIQAAEEAGDEYVQYYCY